VWMDDGVLLSNPSASDSARSPQCAVRKVKGRKRCYWRAGGLADAVFINWLQTCARGRGPKRVIAGQLTVAANRKHGATTAAAFGCLCASGDDISPHFAHMGWNCSPSMTAVTL